MPDLESARAHNSTRLNDIAAVEAGAHESNQQLLSGFPFAFSSIQRSAQIWIGVTIEDLEQGFHDNARMLAALKSLHTRFDHLRLARVIKTAESARLVDIAQRAHIYAAFIGGSSGARSRVAAMCMAAIRPATFDAPFYLATALGLTTTASNSMDACRTAGFKALEQIATITATLKEASKAPAMPEAIDEDDEEQEFLQAVLEDRAEYWRPRTKPAGVVVVPAYTMPPPTGRDDRGRVKRDLEGIAGKRLPLIPTGDVAAHMAALDARAPHLHELFDGMLTDTAMSPHVRLRPWLLVGEPGSGKSWAAREFADVLGLPVLVFDAGSSSDSAFAGTPAQWSSAGASKPMQLIGSSKVANPLVVLDEIDKSASSPANGALHNALLSFLDPGSAANIHDPALELPVDLSHVNYLLTANDLGQVPAPLRDRCRIVRVPNPSMEHVGVLVRRIVDDIARQRGLDPRWEAPFDADEIEIIGEAWGGGSIRRLRQVVQSALNFRAHHHGSC